MARHLRHQEMERSAEDDSSGFIQTRKSLPTSAQSLSVLTSSRQVWDTMPELTTADIPAKAAVVQQCLVTAIRNRFTKRQNATKAETAASVKAEPDVAMETTGEGDNGEADETTANGATENTAPDVAGDDAEDQVRTFISSTNVVR